VLAKLEMLLQESCDSIPQPNVAEVSVRFGPGRHSWTGTDFRGGEFAMTEQRPRMQSRPIVLPLKLGDAAITGTSVRPFKGTRGCYRVNLKHAVSRVQQVSRPSADQ